MKKLINIVLRTIGHAVPLNPVFDRLYKGIVPNILPNNEVILAYRGSKFRLFRTVPHTLLNQPDYYIYYFGMWEPRQTRAVSRLVKRSDICLDIGANIGWYTMLLSKLVGDTGAVHAFEPDPRAFFMLSDNVTLNEGPSNIVLNKIGLSKIAGSGTLFTIPESL